MPCKSGGPSCRFPGRFSFKVDIYGVVKKKRATSGFGLQVMRGGFFCFQVPVNCR